MKKLVLAMMLVAPVALAAPRHPEVYPVPAPEVKTVPEHEEAPGPMKFWDTHVLNNEQPPLAAALFNFALLALIFYRYGKKPVADGLKNRKITIASAIEEAERILKEALGRKKRYNAKLKNVEEDAEQGKQALVGTGRGEAETISRGAEEKAQRIQRDAKFLLEQEKKQTQLDLVRETIERAAREAEQILVTHVSMDDHERLADEFIATLSKDYEKGLRLP